MNKLVSFKMTTTALVTTIIVIVLGIYDLVCVTIGSVNTSVSHFLANAGAQAPVVVFAFGFVAGHLFGYMTPIDQNVDTKT